MSMPVFAEPDVVSSPLNKDNVVVSSTRVDANQISSINDFIKYQATHIPESVVIAYPGSDYGASDFVDYTMRQLDEFADEAARSLTKIGLKPSVCILARLVSVGKLTRKLRNLSAKRRKSLPYLDRRIWTTSSPY